MAYNSTNPYNINQNPNYYEQAAGVTPPSYQSTVDSNGNLKSGYAVDPNQSSAFAQEKSIAQSADLSPWAQMQMQQNTLATQGMRDQANAQAQGSAQAAQEHLMATGGGTGSGAAAFLASQGAKNAVMANQNIGAQAQQNALGIQATDAQNKQSLLGQVANTETAAQSANASSAMADASNANAFNQNRYSQQMGAWAADKTAQGVRDAASNSGKGK